MKIHKIYWGNILCENDRAAYSLKHTNDWKKVTCKKCLKLRPNATSAGDGDKK